MTGDTGRSQGFFARRWRGEVPVARLLWRDMLAVGTLVNVAASLLALILAAQGVPSGVPLALHLAPLPYNVFLVAALWRTPGLGAGASALALAWLALMVVV